MSAPDSRRSAAGTTRAQLLARLHCIKRDRQWSDDEYRDILQSVSGERSATALDFAGLARAVAMLGGKPVRVAALPSETGDGAKRSFRQIIDRATAEKQPLLRKIAAVCDALGVATRYADGVAKRQCGGLDRRLEMMSYHELYRVAQALSNTLVARQKKAAAGSVAAEEVPA